MKNYKTNRNLRNYLYRVIFFSGTPEGKGFDIILLIAIVLSVFVVMLDSVVELHEKFMHVFFLAEWIFTILFTVEYIVRLWVSRKPLRYILSFYGIIDLLSILPTYLSLIIAGSQYLVPARKRRFFQISTKSIR